jgi:hypothetical protein
MRARTELRRSQAHADGHLCGAFLRRRGLGSHIRPSGAPGTPRAAAARAILSRLTGGEVVVKSSEATEFECDGVRGAMPMNW